MASLPSVLIGFAAVVSIAFGIRYFVTRQFMPYHAVVAGKAWSEIERGTQTAILGMLKIVGGGLAAYSVSLLWLLLPLGRGETWAAWAILSVSACVLAPTLYVTIWLRRQAPAAKTPIVPTLVVLALIVAGVAASLL